MLCFSITQSSIPDPDPDPHGSALILLSLIRIRFTNTDPDLQAMSLAKNNTFNLTLISNQSKNVFEPY
jgi:hypothetical protein